MHGLTFTSEVLVKFSYQQCFVPSIDKHHIKSIQPEEFISEKFTPKGIEKNFVSFAIFVKCTNLFLCRGLFWSFVEQESHTFSIQCHEQPNVLGINFELLGIFIKVKIV